MRNIVVLTLIFISGIIIISCNEDNNFIQSSLLYKSWTYSYEESTSAQFEVYRPTNYKKFPPSRFRQVFNLKENNLCEYLVLLPNDSQYLNNGNWEFDEKTNVIKIYNENSEILYVYEVIELRDNLLKLKANNP